MPLPVIEWSAGNSTVATAVSQVQDETVRDILNKELRARSALASSLADLKPAIQRLASMRTTAEKVARSLEPQTLDLYTGAYEFSDLGGFTVNVTRTGKKLYATGSNQPPLELLPCPRLVSLLPPGTISISSTLCRTGSPASPTAWC